MGAFTEVRSCPPPDIYIGRLINSCRFHLSNGAPQNLEPLQHAAVSASFADSSFLCGFRIISSVACPIFPRVIRSVILSRMLAHSHFRIIHYRKSSHLRGLVSGNYPWSLGCRRQRRNVLLWDFRTSRRDRFLRPRHSQSSQLENVEQSHGVARHGR